MPPNKYDSVIKTRRQALAELIPAANPAASMDIDGNNNNAAPAGAADVSAVTPKGAKRKQATDEAPTSDSVPAKKAKKARKPTGKATAKATAGKKHEAKKTKNPPKKTGGTAGKAASNPINGTNGVDNTASKEHGAVGGRVEDSDGPNNTASSDRHASITSHAAATPMVVATSYVLFLITTFTQAHDPSFT